MRVCWIRFCFHAFLLYLSWCTQRWLLSIQGGFLMVACDDAPFFMQSLDSVVIIYVWGMVVLESGRTDLTIEIA
jgi:hypothetical protein